MTCKSILRTLEVNNKNKVLWQLKPLTAAPTADAKQRLFVSSRRERYRHDNRDKLSMTPPILQTSVGMPLRCFDFLMGPLLRLYIIHRGYETG